MVTSQSLKTLFVEKASLIESSVVGVSEEKAKQQPAAGEWCAREVLYHLSGDVNETFLEGIERFLKEDKPQLGVSPGVVYLTPEREKAPLGQLAAGVAAQYRQLGEMVAGLSQDQLARIGRIEFLKQARGNDEISLGEWVSIIGNYHLGQHIAQLQACTK